MSNTCAAMPPAPAGAAPDAHDAPLSTLEIDLGAIARNYLFLRKKLAIGADCAAVVKTDAYGLGASEIAKALHAQGCRHFFVATFEEGLALHAALPKGLEAATIYVLHGAYGAKPEDFALLGLVPVLNTPGDIAHWTAFSQRAGKKQQAIVHIDTGMNRLGLTEKETAAADLGGLDVRYVMSHLACADEPAHPKNAEQLALFKKLIAAMNIPARLSFANSGGIFLGEDYHFDLARPGCGIYGINSQPGTTNPMHNVVTLKGRILQVRQIDRDGTVGYGAGYKVSRSALCATVSLGYGDGYFRSLAGQGIVFIGGQECPVIGRVSMDSIVVDVSGLKTPPAPGDWAEIIGPRQSVDDVAQQAGTIGYEVLTALGKRYKRTYT